MSIWYIIAHPHTAAHVLLCGPLTYNYVVGLWHDACGWYA